MVALTLGANVYFVFASNGSPHGMAEADYYRASLAWDQRREREVRFDSLGLGLELTEAEGWLRLAASGAGNPKAAEWARLPALRMKLVFKRPDDPSADREIALDFESGSGAPAWRARMPGLRPGKWKCRAVLENESGPVMERSFSRFEGG